MGFAGKREGRNRRRQPQIIFSTKRTSESQGDKNRLPPILRAATYGKGLSIVIPRKNLRRHGRSEVLEIRIRRLSAPGTEWRLSQVERFKSGLAFPRKKTFNFLKRARLNMDL
jgi:hypothetical protein